MQQEKIEMKDYQELWLLSLLHSVFFLYSSIQDH